MRPSATRSRGDAGRNPSVPVNAASRALLLTGKLVATHSETAFLSQLMHLIAQAGGPLEALAHGQTIDQRQYRRYR